MAVRPKRRDPISTRPIYLPRVPAKELRQAAGAGISAEQPHLLIYADVANGGLDLEALARRLDGARSLTAAVAGEFVSCLVGRPQTEVRDTVAALANRLAWARIRDAGNQDYRSLPLRGEVDGEEARLRARSLPEYEGLRGPSTSAALLYDGIEVQAAYRELLHEGKEDGADTRIVVTDRRLAHWDADAAKWSRLAVLEGAPIVASVADDGGPADAAALAEEIRRALERSAQ